VVTRDVGGLDGGPSRRGPSRLGRAAFAIALLAALLGLAAPATATAKPIFGIVPQDGALPSTSDLDLMPGAGIDGMRTMLHWAGIERSPGEYDWSTPDAIIRETTNRGIEPFVFLYGTPEWATQQDGRGCEGGECTVFAPKSKATRDAFGRFAAAAAARYGPGGDFWEAPVDPPAQTSGADTAIAADGPDSAGGCPIPILCTPEPPPNPPPPPPPVDPPLPTEPPCGCTEPSPIRVWQIWNEMNTPKYFAPKVNVGRYASLLESAADGIRSVDPGAEIVLGGMWGPHSARDVVMPTNDYLKRLYAQGAEDDFDSIAIHPYGNNSEASLAQLRSARRTVRQAGDPKAGMWVTEVGWAGRGPADNPYVKGLIGQARVLTRALTAFKRKARSFNLHGVFWYSWRDKRGGDAICDWCGHAGLRTKKGEPKPAWRAFVRVARP